MSVLVIGEQAGVVPNAVRRRNVDLALQSVSLEGGRIDGEFAARFVDYANGKLNEDQLIKLALAYYGIR